MAQEEINPLIIQQPCRLANSKKQTSSNTTKSANPSPKPSSKHAWPRKCHRKIWRPPSMKNLRWLANTRTERLYLMDRLLLKLRGSWDVSCQDQERSLLPVGRRQLRERLVVLLQRLVLFGVDHPREGRFVSYLKTTYLQNEWNLSILSGLSSVGWKWEAPLWIWFFYLNAMARVKKDANSVFGSFPTSKFSIRHAFAHSRVTNGILEIQSITINILLKPLREFIRSWPSEIILHLHLDV